MNGKKVGNRILEPAQTDYEKIALYSTYDITSSLRRQNALGVILGNGRCIEREDRQITKDIKIPVKTYEYTKLIAQIHIHLEQHLNLPFFCCHSQQFFQGHDLI